MGDSEKRDVGSLDYVLVEILVNACIDAHCRSGIQFLYHSIDYVLNESQKDLIDPSLFESVRNLIGDYIQENFRMTPIERCVPGKLREEGQPERVLGYVCGRLNMSARAS